MRMALSVHVRRAGTPAAIYEYSLPVVNEACKMAGAKDSDDEILVAMAYLYIFNSIRLFDD